MKIIDEIYPSLTIPQELYLYVNPEEAIFFDIETTGLNKSSTALYLIGCGFYKNGILNTRFYFGETPDEELIVLKSFFEFVAEYKSVIHFNGTKFDLPYLDYKAKKYSIENPLTNISSIDIYKLIKPLRYLIFRESMRQKCVENFMDVTRDDIYNGGELIDVYHHYVKYKNNEDFTLLMLHNREDILGMHKIIPILRFLNLWDCEPIYVNHAFNDYVDFNNNLLKEIIITFRLNTAIPKPFTVQFNDLYYKFDAENDFLYIRIPIIEGNMNHYYENYKDYVYLLQEKRCVHKSIAEAIDKSLKTKADKESCYVPVNGSFIPTLGYKSSKSCGKDYKTRNNFMLLNNCSTEESFDFSINDYGKHLLYELLNNKPKRKKQSPMH